MRTECQQRLSWGHLLENCNWEAGGLQPGRPGGIVFSSAFDLNDGHVQPRRVSGVLKTLFPRVVEAASGVAFLENSTMVAEGRFEVMQAKKPVSRWWTHERTDQT